MMCFVITVVMVILLRYFGSYGIIFMTVFTTLDFSVILDGKFTGTINKLIISSLIEFDIMS
jgi:hypothetical protein